MSATKKRGLSLSNTPNKIAPHQQQSQSINRSPQLESASKNLEIIQALSSGFVTPRQSAPAYCQNVEFVYTNRVDQAAHSSNNNLHNQVTSESIGRVIPTTYHQPADAHLSALATRQNNHLKSVINPATSTFTDRAVESFNSIVPPPGSTSQFASILSQNNNFSPLTLLHSMYPPRQNLNQLPKISNLKLNSNANALSRTNCGPIQNSEKYQSNSNLGLQAQYELRIERLEKAYKLQLENKDNQIASLQGSKVLLEARLNNLQQEFRKSEQNVKRLNLELQNAKNLQSDLNLRHTQQKQGLLQQMEEAKRERSIIKAPVLSNRDGNRVQSKRIDLGKMNQIENKLNRLIDSIKK